MSMQKQTTNEQMEPELEAALRNFRASVQAWSEAEYSRPRTAMLAQQHASWRLALGWALGCVLAAGSLAGGLYARRHQQQLAAQAAALQAAHQRQLAAERPQAEQKQQTRENVQARPKNDDASTDDSLMATVDTDVSREVPEAMEPLAQMMDGSTGSTGTNQ